MNEDDGNSRPTPALVRDKLYLVVALLLTASVGVYLYASRLGSSPPVDSTPAPAGPARPSSGAESTGLVWMEDFQAAQKKAAEQNKLLLVDFYATWCGPCQMMDREVFPRQDVAAALKSWIAVKVDVDRNRDLARERRIMGVPTLAVLTPTGETLARIVGGYSAGEFISWIAKAEKAWAEKQPPTKSPS